MKDIAMKNSNFPDSEAIRTWNLRRLTLVVFAMGLLVGGGLNLLAFGSINFIQIVNLVMMSAGVCVVAVGPLWIAQQAYIALSGRTSSD